MTHQLKIDFVSDVVCPWCIIGLRGLQQALERTSDLVQADIAFQPFELNPKMPAEGQSLVEHVVEKYGSTPEQSKSNRAMIRDARRSVQTKLLTGLPGRPKTKSVLPGRSRVAKTNGLPGRMRSFVIRSSKPSSRKTAGT